MVGVACLVGNVQVVGHDELLGWDFKATGVPLDGRRECPPEAFARYVIYFTGFRHYLEHTAWEQGTA